MKNKVCCVFMVIGKQWQKIGKCAVDSFKKWHPNIDTFVVDDNNSSKYNDMELIKKINTKEGLVNKLGPMKYALGYHIAKEYNYDKVIILGADTITCESLDEFLDNNEDDVLATLDYNYQPDIAGWTPVVWEWDEEDENNIIKRFRENAHINADVICFNNINAIYDIITMSLDYNNHFGEQFALNKLFSQQKYSFNVVDGPERLTNFYYNGRVKNGIQHFSPTGEFHPHHLHPNCCMSRFYVNDGKLYAENNKQIKVWHYIEAFGISELIMSDIIDYFIFNIFNDETKNFFEKECNCGNFFHERYNN